jgi:uncharacterized membrane protein
MQWLSFLERIFLASMRFIIVLIHNHLIINIKNMKKILYLLWLISFCLIGYLAIEQTYRFDIASTKNEHLLNSNKAKIDEMQDIAEVKEYAKKMLEIDRQNFKIASTKAWHNFYLFLCLIALQLVILGWIFCQKKEKN